MPRSLHQSKQSRGGFLFRSLDFPLLADRLGCKMQVFRRKNGIWYARFTLNGKRLMRSIHLSTDKVDRDVALRKTYEIMLEVEQEQRLGIQKRTIPTLAVFDPLGRKVASFTIKGSGRLDLASLLSSGVYFVRLESVKVSATRKIVLLR